MEMHLMLFVSQGADFAIIQQCRVKKAPPPAFLSRK